METITLKQAIEQAEERGQRVRGGNFDTFIEFLAYFKIHYQPILEELQEKWQGSEEGAKRFFAEDLMEIFR